MIAHLAVSGGVLALLTVVPGPDMAVVTRHALTGGRSAAVRAAGGVAVGLFVWGTLTVLGLIALIATSPVAYPIIRALGAAYLVFMGVQALLSARRTDLPPETARPGRAFLSGLGTNLLNPKIAVFYMTMLPTLAPPTLPSVLGLALVAGIHVAMTFGWLSTYAYALHRARSFFERPSVRASLSVATGVVFIGFGLSLVAEAALSLL